MTALRAALMAALAVAALTLTGCTGGVTSASTPASLIPLPAAVPDLQQAYVTVVARVLPSVVQITADGSLGSGIVFDTDGNIVTNAHVVGQATQFQVRLADSPKPLPATLVGSYPPDDLAVIKLDQPPASLRPAQFADSSTLQVGQIVLAMGNPLGLDGSVTNGIISATGRTVTEPPQGAMPSATLADVIQTSAAVNPGNSGGALVDLDGKVVGIPTLGATQPQADGDGSSPASGIGFAIPSNVVTDIAGQLIANDGSVLNSRRAALGVQVVTVVGSTGQPTGLGIVSVTPGGPAAAARLQADEVITAVNDTPVRRAPDLAQVLAKLDPGQTVPVTVTTPQGASRTVDVTLGQLPGS